MDSVHAGVLLHDGFHLESFGAFADHVAASRAYSRDLHAVIDDRTEPIFSVVEITRAAVAARIASAGGILIGRDVAIDDRRRFDVVFVPNIELSVSAARKPIATASETSWLRFQYEQGATIVVSGAAVFVLAEAGLARISEVVVPWWLVDVFAERFPGVVIAQGEPNTDAARIMTGAQGFDHLLAVKILQRFVSDNMAHWLARRRVGIDLLSGDSPYGADLSDEGDPLVRRAQAWLEQNYAQPIRIDKLARRLNVSVRALERHFKFALGKSPVAQLQAIRMRAASRILARRAFSVGRVANLVGYTDVRFFRQIFARETGMTPEAFVADSEDGSAA